MRNPEKEHPRQGKGRLRCRPHSILCSSLLPLSPPRAYNKLRAGQTASVNTKNSTPGDFLECHKISSHENQDHPGLQLDLDRTT